MTRKGSRSLLEVSSNLVVGDCLIVLSGDENGVNAQRDSRAVFNPVLNRDLRFSVRSQPLTGPVLSDLQS